MNTPTPPSPPRSMSLLLLGIFQARWAPKVGSSGSSVSSSLVFSFFLFSFFFWEVRFFFLSSCAFFFSGWRIQQVSLVWKALCSVSTSVLPFPLHLFLPEKQSSLPGPSDSVPLSQLP